MTRQGDRRRTAILAAIRLYRDRYGYGPTQADIADITGLGLTSVRYHLGLLEAWGQVQRGRNSPRSLEVV